MTRPHGVRGEVRLKLYNSDSDLLLEAEEVVVEYPDGEQRAVDVRSIRRSNDALLLHLEGCDDREGAEDLRGAKILWPRESFPPPEEGEFYVCDVIGAQVVSPEGEVGRVEDLLSYPSVDVLVVSTPEGKLEVPLVDDLIDSVDTAAGLVKLKTREGLQPG